ncbi:MAG: EF-hand domain-containing protein [Gammaproteobacteria bacterium]|nr:EF-hand domain-containing protein [Gammaproteobacteria bacterium]
MKKIVIALALCSAPALAQQQMPNLEEMFFKQFDSNQDGQVSRAEFLAPTEAQFDHMDRDRNGALDQAEVKAFNAEMEQRMQEMRQRMQQQGGQQGMPRR